MRDQSSHERHVTGFLWAVVVLIGLSLTGCGRDEPSSPPEATSQPSASTNDEPAPSPGSGVYAAGPLMSEHALIGAVCEAVEAEAKRLEQGQALDRDRVALMIDFHQSFTDGSHHIKEERFFFPAMRKAGMDTTPIERFEAEHEQSRQLLRKLSSALSASADDPQQATVLAELLRELATLTQAHIIRESPLFAAAEQHIKPADQRRLIEQYETFEREELPPGFSSDYRRIAAQLIE